MNEHTYHVAGMHCASCEILIEKKLLELKEIKSVEASTSQGQVLVEFENEKPSLNRLNKIFAKEGYQFFDQPISAENNFKPKELIISAIWGIILIAGFIGLNKLGLSGLINVNLKSSLPMFFVFGLIAGVSSCAALVGGIILSMAKQWSELYASTDPNSKKLLPHLMFNAGRLASYGVLGAVLGAIGSQFNFSLKFGPILVLAVSVLMIFLALQMIGFKKFRGFQLAAPKFITRFIADESNFRSRLAPFLMGAFTFFLPCGFTITAQGLSLLSGSAIQGGLIMLLFALGTLPMLLIIGLSSVKLAQKTNSAARFLKAAGILVLFFAFYNINAQLNVLGITSFSDIGLNSSQTSGIVKKDAKPSEKGLPPIVDGKQIVKMDASANGYSPSYFKVRAGLPVRWEITDKGTSGCTNAIISKSLFAGEIPLTSGQTSIKEFTPEQPGKYKFSCWMGMISGMIEVVDSDSLNQPDVPSSLTSENNLFSPSGAESLGGSCSAGGGCGCGGR